MNIYINTNLQQNGEIGATEKKVRYFTNLIFI